MSRKRSLRDLDDRALPRLADRYAHARNRAAMARDAVRSLTPHGAGASVTEVLDNLDVRTARKSWGLVARQPVAVLSVAVAVCVSGFVSLPFLPASSNGQNTAVVDPTPTVGSTYVGPQVGEDIAAYIANRASELDRLAASVPQGPTLAVLSFTGFTSIQDAATMLAGISSRRVFFGVHIAGAQTDIGQSAVTNFVQDTRAAFAKYSQARSQLAKTYKQFAQAVPNTTAVQRHYRELYLNLSHSNRIESTQLGRYCDCIIGAVVESTIGKLAALAKLPGIRVIDVAPADVPPNSLGFRPISPDEKGKIVTGTGNDFSEIVPQP